MPQEYARVWGRACFNALFGEKHQIQLSNNFSPANNRPLDCRLAENKALKFDSPHAPPAAIVQNPFDPQALNRYAFARKNSSWR
jgi:hypothetical protein